MVIFRSFVVGLPEGSEALGVRLAGAEIEKQTGADDLRQRIRHTSRWVLKI